MYLVSYPKGVVGAGRNRVFLDWEPIPHSDHYIKYTNYHSLSYKTGIVVTSPVTLYSASPIFYFINKWKANKLFLWEYCSWMCVEGVINDLQP